MKPLLTALTLLILASQISINAQTSIEQKTEALIQITETAEGDDRIQAYINLLDYMVKTSPDKAIVVAEDAITFAKSRNNAKAEAQFVLYLGSAYSKIHKQAQALEYSQEAHRMFTGINDSAGICKAKIGLGYIKIVNGEIGEAIDLFYKAENLAQRLNDYKSHIDALNYLGIINFILDNMNNAVNYCELALQLSNDFNYDEGKALAYEHLGIINIKKLNFDEALKLNTKAFELRQQLDDLTVISEIYDNYSIIYNRLNDFDKAIDFTKKSLELRRQYGDVNGMGSTYMALGNIYSSRNELDPALEYFKTAYDIKKQAGDLRAFTIILRNLSEIYEKKNDFKNAFNYLREFRAYNDSLFGENSRRLLLRAEAKYDLAKKESEILALRDLSTFQERLQRFLIIIIILVTLLAISVVIVYIINRKSNRRLTAFNNEIVDQRNKLQKLNDELLLLNNDRDKFFSVIAHDLRSPFSPLLNYSDIMISEIEKLNKDEIALYAKHINESGKRIYGLLDNLLHWLGINSGKMKFRPGLFDLKKELPGIVELFEISVYKKGIELINSINESLKVFADKEMVSTILRNLISNAIKYCRTNDKIIIASNISDGFVEISVSDTGIGMDEVRLNKLFTIAVDSTNGTNNEPGTGLGLLLCKDMVEKNGGSIRVESKLGIGTTFRFSLPLADSQKVLNEKALELN